MEDPASDKMISTTVEVIQPKDEEENSCGHNCLKKFLTVISIILIVCTFPLSLYFCVKIVREYERAVLFRLGMLRKKETVGPGMFFILPCLDEIVIIDLRTVSFDVPKQEVLTKDSVTVYVDAVVYYNIQKPLDAVCKVENFDKSTRLLAATTLRTILGTKNLTELLSDREAISKAIVDQIDGPTDRWGIEVERLEIKDVILPQNLQRAMAAEAEATREARAKVIQADGELKSSKSLKEASDVISESPAALQLRFLQTLTHISAEKNSTIIFPLPIELMKTFMGNSGVSNEKKTN
jgi:erythrocyte band 7 integral membrane protein